jgi:hypothetical protein
MVANCSLSGEPFCAEGGADGEKETARQAALAIWLGRLPLADCLYPCWDFWERANQGRRYVD